MTETLASTPDIAEQERKQIDHERVQAVLGRLSIDHAANLVASFHGADEHTLGRRADMPDKINSIVSRTDEEGRKSHEIVGQGTTIEEVMYDTWLGMRELETVKTAPLVRMEISKGVDIDFTSIEHYAPKVAPDVEAYKIPDHIADFIEGNKNGRDTYDKTVSVEGWDKQIVSQIERFTQTERGVELIKDLKINSLQTLTPEQAVKFTLSMVHDLSKYSYDEKGVPTGDREDEMTTMQLLEEGFARKGDPNWSGNGVCRNIGSNVKAIFEALKLNQSEVNMLHNTYVGYTGSHEGWRVKETKREVAGDSGIDKKPGHAWNTFTTIDASGDASVTIADVTWSLSKSPEEALEKMDYTLTRMTRMARAMFEKSENKIESFSALNGYYEKFTRDKLDEVRNHQERLNVTQFVATEYLKAADVIVKLVPDHNEWSGNGLPQVPGKINYGIQSLKDNLTTDELTTVYGLDERGAFHGNFDFDTNILTPYIKGESNFVNKVAANKANTLIVNDGELQQKIIEHLDESKVQELASASTRFRIRLRETTPDKLPVFDPENNQDDAAELAWLAQSSRLPAGNRPKISDVSLAIDRGLLKAAGGNQELVNQAIQGRDLYSRLKDYREIVAALTRAA